MTESCLTPKDTAYVTLGGRKWAVPILAARQNRVIDPLILSVLPFFAQIQESSASALITLGHKEYDALLEIGYQAILRAQPNMSREAFFDLPITFTELIVAFPIIAQQTGIFQKSASGEVQAGNALTGMESLPMSAI